MVLAVLAAVAVLGANVAWWVSHDVYDTATVTAKAGQLIASPDTQAAVTALLEDRVVTPALQQTAGSLPGPLQSLGAAVQGQTAPLVNQAVQTAVAAETTHEITARLVATVNAQLVDGTDPISLTPDQLLAIVAPQLQNNRVVSGVVDLAQRSGCCTVVLAQRGDLPFVWQHVATIRAAADVLPVVALVLGLAAVALARRRLRAALVLAVAIAVSGAVVLIALWAGIRWGVDLIGDPAQHSTALVRQAIRITHDVTVGDLRRQSWIIVLAGGATAAVLSGVAVVRRRPKVPA